MRIRQHAVDGLRALARHGTMITNVCGMLVTLQRKPSALGVVGAAVALATAAGNMIKPASVAEYLARCKTLTLPGVDLSGMPWIELSAEVAGLEKRLQKRAVPAWQRPAGTDK